MVQGTVTGAGYCNTTIPVNTVYCNTTIPVNIYLIINSNSLFCCLGCLGLGMRLDLGLG